MDFTLKQYNLFIQKLYPVYQNIPTLAEYFLNKPKPGMEIATSENRRKLCLLRHDVDRLPRNALNTAEIANEIGAKTTYYFRIVQESYNLNIMQRISELGHEVGYHYEDVDLVLRNKLLSYPKDKNNVEKNKLIDMAYESFCKNLETLRRNFDIRTICMHGSPRSGYDNKIIWEKYDYKELGILGEPYLDINWDEFAYFTDTGRRWNGEKYSVRDKVNSGYRYDFKTTNEILANLNSLPNNLMLTIHPERWNDRTIPWIAELLAQNTKNPIKRMIIKMAR